MENINFIMDSLRQDKNFPADKKIFRESIDRYKDASAKNIGELAESLYNHTLTNKWSRRKFYTILYDIILEIQQDDGYSEDLYDLLTNIITDISGGSAGTEKLYNDSSDDEVRLSYVRSSKWWQLDFFSDLHEM